MVRKFEHEGNNFFQCESCKMYYRKRKLAELCEKHCTEKQSCNMEIIKHAVKIENE
jgi:hypothetical protein